MSMNPIMCWGSHICISISNSLIFIFTLSSNLPSISIWMSHSHFKCVESALQTFSNVLCKCPISYPMLETLHHSFTLLPPIQSMYKYSRFYLLKTSHMIEFSPFQFPIQPYRSKTNQEPTWASVYSTPTWSTGTS